jgi:hypothetical protein
MAAAKFVILFIALLTVWLRQENPNLQHDIKIISTNSDVELYLSKYEKEIGNDMAGYKGHIYRVMTYSMHYLKSNFDPPTPPLPVTSHH